MFFVCFLLFSIGVKAQCPTGDVTLSSQAQVDQFKIDYPNCTKINGYLGIHGSVANLNGLSNITTITGSLDISNTTALTDISGLSNLTSVGQDFQIAKTKSLTLLNGLGNLKTIAGFFLVNENALLQNLNGLSSLVSVGQDIDIEDNTVLSDIFALKNTTFNPNGGYGLTILGNPALAVCNLPNFCVYLAKPSGTHPRSISGNLTNCLNEQAVKVACSALPVSLTTFTAKANGNYALLQWKTASEQNNKGFEIWRSGDDGKFIKISEVASQNPNTSTPTVYTFTDKSPANGNNYYKLVQIDNDGKENELAVRDLSFSLSASSLQLYPNPTTANKVTVNWGNSAVNSIKLIDLNGKLLQTIKPKLASTSAIISLVKYPAGTYLLRVEGDQRVEVKKVVKL